VLTQKTELEIVDCIMIATQSIYSLENFDWRFGLSLFQDLVPSSRSGTIRRWNGNSSVRYQPYSMLALSLEQSFWRVGCLQCIDASWTPDVNVCWPLSREIRESRRGILHTSGNGLVWMKNEIWQRMPFQAEVWSSWSSTSSSFYSSTFSQQVELMPPMSSGQGAGMSFVQLILRSVSSSGEELRTCWKGGSALPSTGGDYSTNGV